MAVFFLCTKVDHHEELELAEAAAEEEEEEEEVVVVVEEEEVHSHHQEDRLVVPKNCLHHPRFNHFHCPKISSSTHRPLGHTTLATSFSQTTSHFNKHSAPSKKPTVHPHGAL